ncbi:MAG: molybdenum cofactor biosynthesis protein MoaE [Candidatus Woesearchaeota archaeon]
MVIIQQEPFSFEEILHDVKSKNNKIGAVTSFIGYVRDFDDRLEDKLNHLDIEHYEGMTQKALQEIEKTAHNKWDLIETRIIHRVGVIQLNEPIVFILVASKHRDNAFNACHYIIDYLKTDAPFWKKEVFGSSSVWVKQKNSDLEKTR